MDQQSFTDTANQTVGWAEDQLGFKLSNDQIEAALSPMVTYLLKMKSYDADKWILASMPVTGYAATALRMYSEAISRGAFTIAATEKINSHIAITKNVDVPLHTRWAIFAAIVPDFSRARTMCSELGKFFGEDVVMYDGIVHTDRHETHDTVDIVERIEEYLADYPTLIGRIPPINDIKERLMQGELRLFTYDW